MAWGSTVRQITIADMANSSALIFEGSVIGVRSVYEHKRIYSLINFAISDVISGDYTTGNIELRYLGGRIGEQELRVGEMEMPQMGEQGIYFVESLKKPGVHPLRGWGQGHFRILFNSRSGKREVLTASGQKVSAVLRQVEGLSGKSVDKFNSRVARGIGIAEFESDQPLTVEAFKDQIRALLE